MKPFAVRLASARCPARDRIGREVEGCLLERGLEVEVLEGEALRARFPGTAGDAIAVASAGAGAASPDLVTLEVRCRCEGEAPAREADAGALLIDCGGDSAARIATSVAEALARAGCAPAAPERSYGSEDERKIAERLEDLGYL